MRTLAITSTLVLLTALTGLARAQQSGAIELRTVVEREVQIEQDNGEIELRRVPAGKVVPGDEVIYTIYAVNLGDVPAEDVVVHDPIPEHTKYRDGSAIGADTEITFSVDGGNDYGPSKSLTVVAADGSVRPAQASDYTDIRWKFTRALDPGESRFVRFRARLQ